MWVDLTGVTYRSAAGPFSSLKDRKAIAKAMEKLRTPRGRESSTGTVRLTWVGCSSFQLYKKKETRGVSDHWEWRINRREVGLEVLTRETYSVHSGVSLKNKNNWTDQNERFHICIKLQSHPNHLPTSDPHQPSPECPSPSPEWPRLQQRRLLAVHQAPQRHCTGPANYQVSQTCLRPIK